MLNPEFWAVLLASALVVGTAASAADSLRQLRIERRVKVREGEPRRPAVLRDAA